MAMRPAAAGEVPIVPVLRSTQAVRSTGTATPASARNQTASVNDNAALTVARPATHTVEASLGDGAP
jgi:hypothetical protein